MKVNLQQLKDKKNFYSYTISASILIAAAIGLSLSYQIFHSIIIESILALFLIGFLIFLWQKNEKKVYESEALRGIDQIEISKMNLALDAALIGTWYWNLVEDRIYSDLRLAKLFGQRDKPMGNKLSDFMQCIHPEDREYVTSLIQKTIQLHTPYDVEFRVVWNDGSIHYLMGKGVAYTENGVATEFSGICWDITAARTANQIILAQNTMDEILRDSGPITASNNHLIQFICEILQWEVGVLWRVDNVDHRLHSVSLWHHRSVNINHLETLIDESLSKSEFIEHKFWHHPYNKWIKNIEDVNLSRYQQISQDGLKGSLIVPIVSENTILGILELFQREPYEAKKGIDEIGLLSMISRELIHSLVHSIAIENQVLLNTFLQSTIDAVILASINGTITTWNKGAEKMFGYTEQEMLGNSLKRLFPPERVEEYRMIINKIKEGESIHNFETVRLRKDGRLIWLIDNAMPIYDFQGKVSGVCMIKQNITARKNIEKNLKESEKNLKIFAETTDNWIWTVDQNRKLTFSNAAIFTILGYTVKEALGNDVLLFIPEEDREEATMEFQKFLQIKKGWSGKISRWRHKNGNYKWLESSSEPILNEKDEVIGFRGADRDISARQHLDMIKNEFISTISHELRTPLTSIRGAVGLLFEQVKSKPKSKEYKLLEISCNNCERLINLINDILDLDKMASGIRNFNYENISLIDPVNSAINTNTTVAIKSHISIELDNQLEEKAYVRIDSQRLIQVLNNLISNAIKVSPPREKVIVQLKQNNDRVRISVTDHGPGIPESFKSKIFEKFAQADSSSKRNLEGTGLGLNITKNILEGFGTTINFFSEKNKGTTFYFELPLLQKELLAYEENNHLILICEKDKKLLAELSYHFKKEGFEVIVANNSERARTLIEKESFDAALIDWDLINIENSDFFYEVLKEDEKTKMPIILIGLEGTEDGLTLSQSLPIPILDVLPKPFSKKRLMEIINELKQVLTPSLPKILHVEDDKDLVSMIKMLFIEEAIIEPAYSFEEASQKLEKTSYDLVLLDLILPDGLGSDLLPCLDPKTRNPVPVVIFTIKEDSLQFPLKVDKVLTKTLTPELDLIKVVKSLLAKKSYKKFSNRKNLPNQKPSNQLKGVLVAEILKKMLLVDDDRDILTIVQFTFEESLPDLEIKYCQSGEEAIQEALRFSPDLIILDMMMAKMDGLETMQAMHILPSLSHIPIIFLTAKIQKEEIENYLKLGAIAVIPKPFDPLTLGLEIKKCWEIYNKKHSLHGGM